VYGCGYPANIQIQKSGSPWWKNTKDTVNTLLFKHTFFYNEEWFAITVGKIFTKKSPNGDFLVKSLPNRGLFGEKSP
jgi:hypothetical protein